MPRNQGRRLYSDAGAFQCWIPSDTADRYLSDGLAIPFFLERRDGHFDEVGIQMIPMHRASAANVATISLSEMQANVGITGPRHEGRERETIRAAHQKVFAYPRTPASFADGERAAIARGRWAPASGVEVRAV